MFWLLLDMKKRSRQHFDCSCLGEVLSYKWHARIMTPGEVELSMHNPNLFKANTSD